jgi:hypothetical protein
MQAVGVVVLTLLVLQEQLVDLVVVDKVAEPMVMQ